MNNHNLSSVKIAVACSGGVDSMCLLDIMTRLIDAKNLWCVHVNHGWLEQANQAQDFLEEYSKQKNINFSLKKFSIGEMKPAENNARQARYDFFMQACRQADIQHIFLGHNLNDQAETVLFRLFRGTNSFGLSGILEQKKLVLGDYGLTVHRPFLNITRAEILNYAHDNLKFFYEDPSNEDLKYHRNLIRHEILPSALKINPQAEKNIVKLSELIKEEHEFFQEIVNNQIQALGDLPWSLESFRSIPRTIQRKVLEKIFCTQIRFTDEFLEAIAQGGFHQINFEKDKFFVIKQKQIFLKSTAID